jgi:hypothetical protein
MVPHYTSVVSLKLNGKPLVFTALPTHPPSSPGLHSSEPLWLVIKNHVTDIPGSSNSLNVLWVAVQKVWDGIMEEEIKKNGGQ